MSSLTLFEYLLTKQKWPAHNVNMSVDEMFNEFYSTFLYVFEVCFPKATYSCKDDSHVKWTTKETIESQDKLKEMYWRTRDPSDVDAKIEYARAKRQHSILVCNSKKKYYMAKINKAKNISKESWTIVRNLTSDENVNTSNIGLINNDELITHPGNVANIFNNYFVNEILKLTKPDLQSTSGNDGTQRLTSNQGTNMSDFKLWPTNKKEVIETIDKISSKNSAGADEIPCSILRVCKEVIVEPLIIIINKSFEQGCFPNGLKTSKVVPVHKDKEKDLVKNYRPVAVQSVFSKIFEVIFLRRLIPYLDSKKLLNNQQYGFRKSSSTTDAMFDLLINLYDNLDVVGEQLCIFYDMTKAFDLLSHSVLKNKLIAMGITGRALEWITSYLKDRFQVVSVRHSAQDGLTRCIRSSVSPPINTGVPQGSNLGPILFLLYVNDLPTSISEGKVWLFADDVSHLIRSENNETLREVAQKGLNEVSDWCNQNKLLLNRSKTKALHFYNRKEPDSDPLLRLEGSSIEINSSIKYLGLTISEDLRWQKHIEHTSRRLTAVCYMVRRLQSAVDKEVLMKVYFGCFHSIINYGIIFWGSSPCAQRIFLLQKRIIRSICKQPYLSHCRQLFLDLQVLTMPSLFILESALMVRKHPEIYITNEEVHNYATRQKNKIHVVQINCSLAKYGPRNMFGRIYNKIPTDIRNINDTADFKNSFKKYLLKRPFYSIDEYLVDN